MNLLTKLGEGSMFTRWHASLLGILQYESFRFCQPSGFCLFFLSFRTFCGAKGHRIRCLCAMDLGTIANACWCVVRFSIFSRKPSLVQLPSATMCYILLVYLTEAGILWRPQKYFGQDVRRLCGFPKITGSTLTSCVSGGMGAPSFSSPSARAG